jgi:hypothetical protein
MTRWRRATDATSPDRRDWRKLSDDSGLGPSQETGIMTYQRGSEGDTVDMEVMEAEDEIDVIETEIAKEC